MKKLLTFTLAFSILSAYAENINVKYLGTVNLSEYECSYVSSSLVNRVCFNDKNRKLVLLLKETYYAYCGVPSIVVQNLKNAPSIGRYYNENIKGNFNC